MNRSIAISSCAIAVSLALAAPAWAQMSRAPTEATDDPRRNARIRAAMAPLADEPAIAVVQDAALRHFRLESGTIDSLRSRATGRAFLPSVTVSGNLTRLERDRSVNDPLVVLQTTDLSNDRALGANAALEWDLPETVFNPAELQTYALVGYQVEVLKEVTRLYFIRQQILLSLLVDPPDDPRARVALELRVAEFTGLIDSYTGGAYRRMLRRARRR